MTVTGADSFNRKSPDTLQTKKRLVSEEQLSVCYFLECDDAVNIQNV
jgi:hypothetical protein